MNKKTTYSLNLLCLISMIVLIGLTTPSVASGWLIILFFICLFGFIVFGLKSVALFLGYKSKKVTKLIFVAACIAVSAQILITFQALRPVELVLISLVLGLAGWYVSRAKS